MRGTASQRQATDTESCIDGDARVFGQWTANARLDLRGGSRLSSQTNCCPNHWRSWFTKVAGILETGTDLDLVQVRWLQYVPEVTGGMPALALLGLDRPGQAMHGFN